MLTTSILLSFLRLPREYIVAKCAGRPAECVVMEYVAENDEAKLVRNRTLPLAGSGVVNRVITDICVLDVMPASLKAELVEGVTRGLIEYRTGAPVRFQLRRFRSTRRVIEAGN